jgi:hypothetical protein
MKAVANIIQERRLLEEVGMSLREEWTVLTSIMSDRPSVRGQPALCLPGRRKLLLCSGSYARR